VLNSITFDVRAQNDADLPARIVLLLHRLAIHIRALTTRRPKRWPTMHMTIEIGASPEQTDRISASLSKLVYVVSVKKRARAPRLSRA